MFAALVPPPVALDDLADFLAPRQEAGPELRWSPPDQWHVTLAFMADVPDRRLDELVDNLARAAGRRTPFEMVLAGGGAFPDPARAKVLFMGVRTDATELGRLAAGARAAASTAGAPVDGRRFRPHVTLARCPRPLEATRWVRVLEGYQGPAWPAAEVALVASHLGEGPRRRPRHETVATFPLGAAAPADPRNRRETGT